MGTGAGLLPGALCAETAVAVPVASMTVNSTARIALIMVTYPPPWLSAVPNAGGKPL
jgi:hypothetical protein